MKYKKNCRFFKLCISTVFCTFFLFSCSSFDINSLQSSVLNSSKKALPSIVQLDVKITKTDLSPSDGMRPFLDYFFEDPNKNEQKRTFRFESLGSGVIFFRNGTQYYVITNGHVVGDAEDVTITLNDGQEIQGKVIGKDPRKDVAILSFLSPLDIPIAQLADSDGVTIGEFVLAIGSPYGFQSSVSFGIVSAVNRRGGPSDNLSDFIQTDAAINQGNSGGALLNMQGEVVGINTWISSQTGDSVGLGFAIPINSVKTSAFDLIQLGRIRYGWIGVHFQTIDQMIKKNLDNNINSGVLLTGIYENSPAARAGLLLGDIIIGAHKKQIKEMGDLIQIVGESPINSQIDFKIIRGDKSLTISINIEERQEDNDLANISRLLFPGFVVYPLNDELREELKVENNQNGYLVRQVVAGSIAQSLGLKAKDIIVAINGESYSRITEFYTALNNKNLKSIEITILREGEEQVISFSRDVNE